MAGPVKRNFSFKCVDFVVSDFRDDSFEITMYGIDENRKSYCAKIEDFKPFLYIKVGNNWTINTVKAFIDHLKLTSAKSGDYQLSKLLDENVHDIKLVKHKTLYDFDANKYYNFIYISSHNLKLMYKLKGLYYDKERQKVNKGVVYEGTYTKIYETQVPPLLRFFHIQNISPSGWVEIQKYKRLAKSLKSTNCDYEVVSSYKNVVTLPEKETSVPYKICSFDIEASSSHGDFPTPIKNYKKVGYDIIEFLSKREEMVSNFGYESVVENLLHSTFGFGSGAGNMSIDLCYPKNKDYNIEMFRVQYDKFRNHKIYMDEGNEDLGELHNYFQKSEEIQEGTAASGVVGETNYGNDEVVVMEDEENQHVEKRSVVKSKPNSKNSKSAQSDSKTIYEILESKQYTNQEKTAYLVQSLNKSFPPLEGDYVTFIGSTFVNYGEEQSTLNHCICLQNTTNLEEDSQELECYDNERDVLCAWTRLIQREDPDIIIGYNIFGFDYPFMFDRAKENNCVDEFIALSRDKESPELTISKETDEQELQKTSIILASGAYDLRYPSMPGRLQIDVFTYMRKEFILPSYKLDYVSSYLISDSVKGYVNNRPENTCFVKTKNMKGITLNCYVHFEIINHSNDYYENGRKFKVIRIEEGEGFEIEGNLENIENEKVSWGLAKDDVTPQDIFAMTRQGPDQKGIIAKYCIQDCNLVHQIFQKIDIMTTYVEMSKICSVPISFLMMRGQGIKLTSYIAKKCREKDTLMPLISKGNMGDAYEGAIVLEPKCDLYLDNPVACVDYSSLYPSSIISENISHDSKVWTKEFDLHNNLIRKTGIVESTDHEKFKYDNLPGYKYVDIKYDTFGYKRDPEKPKSKAKKVLTGYKICRFAQFPDGEKAIMPSILSELLAARKATKKQMAKETDPFMKNILDKRQLSIKVTANSLYGQTGAKTSTFYEMDVAASTTATGRKLLIYAREIIENVYQNMNIDTKYGPMLTNAEYVYGDSVASYTPIYVKVNNDVSIMSVEEIGDKFGKSQWKKCVEPGKQTKEYIDLSDQDLWSWSDKGWTRLYTVIRHKLADHKKMIRVLTHTGCVDVTDDHSLLRDNESCDEISPNDCHIGTSLKHEALREKSLNNTYKDIYEKYTFTSQIQCAKYVNMLNAIKNDYNIEYNVDEDKYIVTHVECNKNPNAIKKMVELKEYDGYVYDLTTYNHHFAAGVGNMIVHNTDSVFFTFNLKDANTGEPVTGQKALEVTIEMAKEAGEVATKFLKKPHDLEYEKTFLPFCLLSKKRYVGMLYEEDPHKCKRKSMGIVLKRRDNAPIVKDVYGGIIDILMKDKDINKSIDFLDTMLRNIVDEQFGMDKLIISKSLRSFYKNPQQIAHKVLADRMGERDPGNKPGPGDRIPYVYILTKNKKDLQGNKIEHPDYIREKKLRIDYGFYISNQIMKPVLQIYGLVLYNMPQFQRKKKAFIMKLNTLRQNMEDEEKYLRKEQQLKDKEVEELLFKKYLIINQNKANNNTMITGFFKKKD